MKSDDVQPISTRSTYVITFLLGFAFTVTLLQSTWKTAIERKQKDFHFEILSIQQSVASNVLAGNDVTNNVAAFISSNVDVTADQFNAFCRDVLERNEHIEAINYYSFTGDDWVNEFRLVYETNRDKTRIEIGYDIYSNKKYTDAVDTSVETKSVVPAPPDVDNDPDRKYWLFKAIYSQDNSSSIKQKKYDGVVKGVVSVLVSPTKLLGEQGANSSLTITMFSDTSNLYGRQLLYYNDPSTIEVDKPWKVETLREEKLIQLPPYSIKIIIEKNLYFSDLEYHLLFVAVLISVGILMMLYGLVRARIKYEGELKSRNAVIEQKVEEQTHELAIARDEALEAARLKSEFLASMSHEIRTPLNAIIGMSDLMSETSLSKEQGRYVSVFRKAGDALLSLVNDILDLSKIEANQLVLEDIPFNASELIEEVAEIYALKAADKDIEIITHIATNINTYRIGDPGRLKQIMLNLISNALKFTEEGEIVVQLYSDDKQEQDYLTISVSDTGIGISQDKLKSIFASFTQADASTTRKYGGTGLGLTISKSLTEMMGGNIRVESEEYHGSKFYIEVKLPEQEQRSIFEPLYKDKNIVIIDGRKSNCTSLQEQLSAYGANCFLANTMDEAIRILKDDTKYDVYIIDSEILFRDGKIEQEISSLIQAEKIVLSVNPKDISEYSKLAKANHINRTLIKPIKRKEMLHDVNGILNPSRVKENEHNETYSDVNEAEAKHILLVEDNPDNRMLIKAYLKKTAHTLDEAENGEIAVEMYKQNNYDLVLMDVQMPVMDGHEATRLIRDWETEQNKERVTIISLTAHAIREEIDKCMAAGCDKHISKPVKKATLLQTISETV